MSKDKGGKNHKKAAAKNKAKSVSAYKAESKSRFDKQTTLEPFSPKPDTKDGGGSNPKKSKK